MIRSTVPPGTVEDVTAILKAPLEGLGLDVTVAMCPEFLREGTGIADFYAPPYTVIGSSDLRAIDLVSRLLSFVDAPLRIVHPCTAEALKYAANAFHATKVSFANELGDFQPCWRRQPGSHGALLRGRDSQHLTSVSPAGLRLRRFVSSKGPSFPAPYCTHGKH